MKLVICLTIIISISLSNVTSANDIIWSPKTSKQLNGKVILKSKNFIFLNKNIDCSNEADLFIIANQHKFYSDKIMELQSLIDILPDRLLEHCLLDEKNLAAKYNGKFGETITFFGHSLDRRETTLVAKFSTQLSKKWKIDKDSYFRVLGILTLEDYEARRSVFQCEDRDKTIDRSLYQKDWDIQHAFGAKLDLYNYSYETSQLINPFLEKDKRWSAPQNVSPVYYQRNVTILELCEDSVFSMQGLSVGDFLIHLDDRWEPMDMFKHVEKLHKMLSKGSLNSVRNKITMGFWDNANKKLEYKELEFNLNDGQNAYFSELADKRKYLSPFDIAQNIKEPVAISNTTPLSNRRNTAILKDRDIPCIYYLVSDVNSTEESIISEIYLLENVITKVDECHKFASFRPIVVQHLNNKMEVKASYGVSIGEITSGLFGRQYDGLFIYDINNTSNLDLIERLTQRGASNASLYYLITNEFSKLTKYEDYIYAIPHFFYFFAKEYGERCEASIPISSRGKLTETFSEYETRGGFTRVTKKDVYEYVIENEFLEKAKIYGGSLAFGLSSPATRRTVASAIDVLGCNSNEIKNLRKNLLHFSTHFDGIKYKRPIIWPS